jgi:glycosyltransferase involved in cell wall biosynthesis
MNLPGRREGWPEGRAKLSVVIPCYDSVDFLVETVDSLRVQDLADTEVIFVDDGSRDDTVGLIKWIMGSSPACAMRLIEQPNAGLAGARNTGIAAAHGRYVLPLDADDLIVNGMLARFVDVLDSEPGVDMVYGDREDFGDVAGIQRSGRFELSRLKYFNQLPYCAMYRRSLWQKAGGYQTNVSGLDDWNFWIATSSAGAVARHVPDVFFRHRRRRSSQLWSLLSRYEAIYSQIVLNNAACYSREEVDAAELHLREGMPSRVASLSRMLFLKFYYRSYEGEGGCACWW